MKTVYIEKVDKPRFSIRKIKIEKDSYRTYIDFQKEKNIKKLIKKLVKDEVSNVVLSKELYNEKKLINALNAYNINIFDGRWLEKYLALQILDFVIIQKNIKKEETEIAVTLNQITDLSISIIKILRHNLLIM